MGKRALRHLKNLGNWAISNTRKTYQSKLLKPTPSGKENAPGKENHTRKIGNISHEDTLTHGISNGSASDTCMPHVIDAETRPRLNDFTRSSNEDTRQSASNLSNESLQIVMPIAHVPLPEEPDERAEIMFTEASDIDGADACTVDLPEEDTNSIPSDSDTHSDHSSLEDESHAQPGPSRLGSARFQPKRGQVGKPWAYRKPPSELQALDGLEEIENLLRPRREGPQKRYKESTVKNWSKKVLQDIKVFLNLFTNEKSLVKGRWTEASEQASSALGKPSKYSSRRLREEAKKFLTSKQVPESPYGSWNKSRIDEDEELAQEINIHLQGKGKYVKADDIATYLNQPEVQEKWGLKKSIGRATCKRWMHKLKWRWVKTHKGLYVDGHEREDVVKYRQETYLPTWYEIQPRMRTWNKDGIQEPLNLPIGVKPCCPWFHDESIYYAHDRRESQWVLEDASPAPYAKGEGPSLMDAEYMSPDHGFCRSPDGKETARVIFRPGKARDGYFENSDILDQATKAMDICEKYYPDEDHIFIFDNATIHLKRPENALSARRMPKNTPKEGSNWGIEVTKRGPDGKIEYGSNGKPLKTKIKMGNGYFSHGRPQEFYFPEGHPRAGVFKGMAIILQERGYTWAADLRAECPKFKCAPGATRCCCRRILYNEPDFVNVKSLLEEHCEKRGFRVLFLPKFHCELNPLEMVWGRSKYHYRLNPPSSKEADLEANMVKALDSVTLDEMRRYSRRSRRFTDAYHRGLDGKQAAWANKKYRGHRVLPETLMDDMEKANV